MGLVIEEVQETQERCIVLVWGQSGGEILQRRFWVVQEEALGEETNTPEAEEAPHPGLEERNHNSCWETSEPGIAGGHWC